ncbi:hypothetical protein [Pseudomonas sp. OVF7]|uniref:hypothetical protein n=1 Tax=unclassified Pseudomonas TaxID=196821 RepID=UPI00272C717B|nr:hypothetical protein [Pseudomonas sp. OVF7]WLD64725.1 hypothetical protein QU606_20455 [Pseudomonas sp. OVF7]
MKIPKFDQQGIHPWMIRHRIAARFFCVIMLPIAPILYAGAILWENREGFSEMKMLVMAAFLPWSDKP